MPTIPQRQRRKVSLSAVQESTAPRPTSQPTTAPPGSAAKIAEMAARVQRRQQCFARGDATEPEGQGHIEVVRAKGNFAKVRTGRVVDEQGELLGPTSPSLSSRLLTLREERNLSQQTAARKAGISRRHLGRLERGEQQPTLSVLWALADFYRVSLDDLVGRRSPA